MNIPRNMKNVPINMKNIILFVSELLLIADCWCALFYGSQWVDLKGRRRDGGRVRRSVNPRGEGGGEVDLARLRKASRRRLEGYKG